jgi:hypothetical protein
MPEKIKPGIWEMAIELHEQGRTYSEIVEKTGISYQALAHYFGDSQDGETKNAKRFRKNVGSNRSLD